MDWSDMLTSRSTSKKPSKVMNVIEAEDFDVESANPFSVPRCGSDVVLVVEGKKLHVHKSVLSLSSPVFRVMFTSSFSEKDASEVKLPTKKFEAVLSFLLHLYPVYSLKDIADDDVLTAVLLLAHEYQAKHVLLKCTAYIERQVADKPTKTSTQRKLGDGRETQCLLFLYLCEKYELTGAFNAVLQKAATYPIDKIERNEHFKMLTMPTQLQLLKAKCRVAEGR